MQNASKGLEADVSVSHGCVRIRMLMQNASKGLEADIASVMDFSALPTDANALRLID